MKKRVYETGLDCTFLSFPVSVTFLNIPRASCQYVSSFCQHLVTVNVFYMRTSTHEVSEIHTSVKLLKHTKVDLCIFLICEL